MDSQEEKKSKILVVDDNATNIAVLQEILTEYDVACASTGAEALRVAEAYKPDLILMDVMMPELNGYDACRQIRDNPALRYVKVIITSAKAMDSERLQGYEAGADDYITKPFNDDELLAKVRVFLRLKSVEQVNHILAGQATELADLNRVLDQRVEERTAELREKNEALSREIHERKSVEDVLRKIRDELEVRVEERTSDLLKANASLQSEVQERKRVEAELAAERKNLKKTVAEQTAQLRETLAQVEDANAQLTEANRHRRHFISLMSHELRTPLNAVIGFADLLKGEFYGSLNDRQKGYVDLILKSSKHLVSLINDLLDISKIDAGSISLDFQRISIRGFFSAIVDMFNTQFRKKNLTVETHLDPTLSTFLGDIRRYKQVMINLVSNAVKYSPENGRIHLDVKRMDRNYIKVEVTDSGVGISPEDQTEIFSEFYQVNRRRDEKLGGVGIGLALSKRLVEAHGGLIGVRSALEKGSTFWFTIPFKESAEDALDETQMNRPKTTYSVNTSTGKKILVVEDNETNLSLVLDMLKIQNHTTIVARNGKEALAAAAADPPDLILMDVQMPVMDGLEATRRLRSMEPFRNTPIVALTASADNSSIRRCLNSGCTEHLSKPVQLKELFAMLNRYVQG